MTDHWDSYLCLVNDALSSIALDMGVRSVAPDHTRPHLLWVWIPMREPRADGLSSAAEAPTLHRIEDALSNVLRRELGAECVGRITGAARREFYFYGPREGALEALVEAALEGEPGYIADCGHQPDPEWRQYLDVLYPSRPDEERMRNRRAIRALAERGDQADTSRPIRHWAYFASRADRDEAAGRLERSGFSVEDQTSDAASASMPYGLCFVHHGPATQDGTDDASFRILDALDGLDGEYDGWESPVITSSDGVQQ